MPVLPRTKAKIPIPFEKPDLNQLIDENSLPMKLHKLINQLNFKDFYENLSATGAPNYPPEDMMSIIMLAFSEGIFSTRKIEERCKRDLYYLFITEQRKPDHSTIARFIKKHKEGISKLGVQIVQLAQEKKIASFETISIDGSKIASLSSKRHSKKSGELEWHRKYLEKKIAKVLKKVEATDKREAKEIKKLEREEKRLQDRLEKTKQAQEELARRQQEIREKDHRESHQINIEEPDARMMPVIATNGYNIQISADTATGIIAAQAVTIARSDNKEFKPQHKKTEEVLGKDTSRTYLGDSGYNSEETLEYLKDNNINAYINDSREKEKQPSVEELKERGKRLTIYDFVFDKIKNEYICPNQKILREKETLVYECEECDGCELKDLCCSTKGKRRITKTSYTIMREAMSERVNRNKEKMKERKSVERVFGQMKWNLGFRKFHRKGIEGATVEMNILAMAINMLKMFNILLCFCEIQCKKNRLLLSLKAIWESIEKFTRGQGYTVGQALESCF